MKDVMIDLETMSTGSMSAIVQIGAVQFDRNTGKIGEQFKMNISLQSCIEAGLRVDGNTVAWWMAKNDAQRAGLYSPEPETLSHALNYFTSYLTSIASDHKVANLHLWGRSPRFDIAILSDAYKVLHLKIEWDFRKEMDVRTIEAIGPDVKKEFDENRKPLTHDGIGDCLHQIAYCSAIWQKFIKTKKLENVIL